MGFWHTGYMEFHEPTGVDIPSAPSVRLYHCALCGQVFDNVDALRNHRFATHPIHRPLLLIAGTELGTARHRVPRLLTEEDVVILHATHAKVNGRATPVERVPGALAGHHVGVVVVDLEYERASARFELNLEVATEEDLAGVDAAFLSMARRGRLDPQSLEGFVQDTRPFATALPYVDGICEYLYGVLAKEHTPTIGLSYETYREKFNRAVSQLSHFQRRGAQAICCLVAFHYNQFVEASGTALGSRPAVASTRFLTWLRGQPLSAWRTAQVENTAWDDFLTDLETEKILRWVLSGRQQLMRHIDEIEAVLAGAMPDNDRPKLSVLLSEAYRATGQLAESRRHATRHRHTPGFGEWAERTVASIDRGNEHVV